MKTRILTGLAIFFIVAVMFLTKIIIPTTIVFDIFVGLLAILAAFEIANILSKSERHCHKYLIVLFPIAFYAYLYLSMHFQAGAIVALLIAIAVIALFFIASVVISLCTMGKTQTEMNNNKIRYGTFRYSLTKAFNTILGCLYPTVLLMLLVPLNHLQDISYIFTTIITEPLITSTVILGLCFVIAFSCDTFAYCTGKLIGGKKLAPKISPEKTIAGAIGGTVWTIIIVVALFALLNSITSIGQAFSALGLNWWKIIIIAFAGSILCQFGDLFESLMKRRANVKDSGDFLPGHGGILDRIDGLLFVIPFVFVLFLLLI